MSSYISNWLNNTIKLSVLITSPSLQFSNGYLYGELLLALGWITSSEYGGFRDSKTTNIRLKNFSIIVGVLNKMGVKYQKKVISLIVTEARGAATDLLVRIKSRYDEILNPPGIPPPLSTTSVRKKVFEREAMTDWGSDDFYVKTMAEIGLHDFNKLDEAIHLRKFHEHQRKTERETSLMEETLYGEKVANTKMRIATQIQRARDRARFMEKWIEEGRVSWSVMMKLDKKEKNKG